MNRSEPWKTSGMVSFTNDIAMIADWLAPAEGVKVVFQRDRNIEFFLEFVAVPSNLCAELNMEHG